MDKKVKAWLITLTVILALLLVAILSFKGVLFSPTDIQPVTYQGVLGMLNKCEILELSGLSGTCSQACKDNFNPDKTCAISGFWQIDEGQTEWRLHHQFSCNTPKGFDNSSNVFCTCCSP